MNAKTWRWSNCGLTAYLPQPVWVSAAFCHETSTDRATGVKQIWPVSWIACRLSSLAASVVAMVAMSNHTAALQIPIAA